MIRPYQERHAIVDMTPEERDEFAAILRYPSAEDAKKSSEKRLGLYRRAVSRIAKSLFAKIDE